METCEYFKQMLARFEKIRSNKIFGNYAIR